MQPSIRNLRGGIRRRLLRPGRSKNMKRIPRVKDVRLPTNTVCVDRSTKRASRVVGSWRFSDLEPRQLNVSC
jgi:hypothetical protein